MESNQSTEFAGGLDKPKNPEEQVVDSINSPNPKPRLVVKGKTKRTRCSPVQKKPFYKSSVVDKAISFMFKYQEVYFTPATLSSSAKLNRNTLRRVLPDLTDYGFVSVYKPKIGSRTEYNVTIENMNKYRARSPESKKIV